jgi:hypothetical protein
MNPRIHPDDYSLRRVVPIRHIGLSHCVNDCFTVICDVITYGCDITDSCRTHWRKSYISNLKIDLTRMSLFCILSIDETVRTDDRI